jgi:hypothetical protein
MPKFLNPPISGMRKSLARRELWDGLGGQTGSETLETSGVQNFLGKVVAGTASKPGAKKR